jgi:N6-L-threonylcarbamoyladenine synthase
MKILSIETSCDETGISILECSGGLKNPSFKVLANNLNSQIKIHAPFGGVFPALAKREHIKNLPILLEKTLKDSNLNKKKNQIELIVVTCGPGLEPALWTGIVFAKELAKKWNVPILGVNHMEGHMLSVFGKNKGSFNIPQMKFPAISLLVSGGHTELVLMKEWMKYKIIGETLDDAAGEAFDKVARMLELPYPGGPEISKLAEEARKEKLGHDALKSIAEADEPSIANFQQKIMCGFQSTMPEFKLPRPMMYSKNFDFSFSGLKTAVLYLIRDLKKENQNILQDKNIKKRIAMEFENAVVETLIHKTKKATEKYNIKTIIVAGGVSANKQLKKEMQKITRSKYALFFPNKDLSTDNSIMIGMTGYIRFLKKNGKIPKNPKIIAQGGLKL